MSLKIKYPNKTENKNSKYLNGDKKVASANENARNKQNKNILLLAPWKNIRRISLKFG